MYSFCSYRITQNFISQINVLNNMNKIVLFSFVIMLGASSCKFFQGEKPAEVAIDSVKVKADAKLKADSIAAATKKVHHAAPAHHAAKAHGKKHH